MRAPWLAALTLLVLPSALDAQEPGFLERTAPLAGTYTLAEGEHMIVTPHADFELLSLFWLGTGEVRGMAPTGGNRFAFGHGLYPAEPFAGSVEFVGPAGGPTVELVLRIEGKPDRRATRLPMVAEEIEILRGGEATLAGLLVTPPGDGPFPAAVVLPSGYNDRYQHWRVAMALLARGVGALVYDARGSGASTGEALPDDYYRRSLIRAEDAGAAIRWLRERPRIDPRRTGVVGWSQGGWLGALVAGADPDVSFWVNVAGNLNPGWQQARHARLNDLRYEGYPEADVEAARRYLDAFYGVAWGGVPWSDYEAKLAAARENDWMRWLEDKGYTVVWTSPEDAAAYAERKRDNVPENDLMAVAQPALGIYFEFDESSPPESAEIFVRGLTRGSNADYLLRLIPNTSHEAWIVPGYQRRNDEPPTRLSPTVFHLVAEWVAERTRVPETNPYDLRE